MNVRRVTRLVIGAAVMELALFAVTRLAPATAPLVRSAYVVVAVIFAVLIWRTRRRSGNDRRRGDRRKQESPRDS